MKAYCFTFLIVGVFCSGCSPTPPASVREMQTNTEFFYHTYQVNVSLLEVNKSFHHWSAQCLPHPGLSMDPGDSTKARLIAASYFEGKPQIYALMAFSETPAGVTEVKTYAWRKRKADTKAIKDAIAVARGSDDCTLVPLGVGVPASGGGGAVVVIPVIVP